MRSSYSCMVKRLCNPHLHVQKLMHYIAVEKMMTVMILKFCKHKQGCSQGGSLGSEEPPRQRKVHLKVHYYTKRSTRMHKKLRSTRMFTFPVCFINDAEPISQGMHVLKSP